jgi:hypothetical protein
MLISNPPSTNLPMSFQMQRLDSRNQEVFSPDLPQFPTFSHLSPLYDPLLSPSTVCAYLPKNHPTQEKAIFSFRNRPLNHNVKVLFQETVAKKPRFIFCPDFSLPTAIFMGLREGVRYPQFRFSAPKTAQTVLKNDKIRTNATQMPVAMVSSLTNLPCVPI